MCAVYQDEFGHSSNLKRHMSVLTDEKPFTYVILYAESHSITIEI